MKNIITKRLNKLEETGLIKVFTFNFNKRMPKGSVGFPDHIVLVRNKAILLEVKIGKDRLSDKQVELKNWCDRNKIDYFIVNEKNIEEIINKILESL